MPSLNSKTNKKLSPAKKRLLKVLKKIPQDKTQKDLANRGITKMSDKQAIKIAKDLEDVLMDLPAILDRIEKSLKVS